MYTKLSTKNSVLHAPFACVKPPRLIATLQNNAPDFWNVFAAIFVENKAV
jgi:hypothetical protein